MTTEVESVLIPRTWTRADALAWLQTYGYKSDQEENILPRYFKFRQRPGSDFQRFVTRRLGGGVMLIMGYLPWRTYEFSSTATFANEEANRNREPEAPREHYDPHDYYGGGNISRE